MTITWFAPFFLLFVGYACCGERRWIAATVVGSFLQGATPIMVDAGGRASGLQTSYFLLPIGLWYLFLSRRAEGISKLRVSGSALFLLGFTVIAVGGAILLPRALSNVVHVTASHGGFRPQLLQPVGTNYIQAFYATCNFLLYICVADSIYRKVATSTDAIRYLAIGTWIAIGLGTYQLFCRPLQLPWPDAVINSNTGVWQHFSQGAFGFIYRMSSTFFEPSMMAMHFLSLFAIFFLGLGRRPLGLTLLFCLIISTSATAAAGLVVLALAFLLLRTTTKGIGGPGEAAMVCVILICAVAIGAAFLSDNSNALVEKLHSHSGKGRTEFDRIAIRSFLDSWGLGVGLGSTRASSFLTTLAACTGIPGLICFTGFFANLSVKGSRSPEIEVRALSLGVLAFLIGWIISVPDIVEPMFWIMATVIEGFSLRAVTRLVNAAPASRGCATAVM